MNRGELIEEAKKRYPIGTMYNALEPNGTSNEVAEATRLPRVFDGSEVQVDVGRRYVYANGKWATVVSYPEGYVLSADVLQVVENYPIY